jgi:hypothetical protein
LAQINTTFSFTDNASSQINKVVKSYETLTKSMGITKDMVVKYNTSSKNTFVTGVRKQKEELSAFRKEMLSFSGSVSTAEMKVRQLYSTLKKTYNPVNYKFGRVKGSFDFGTFLGDVRTPLTNIQDKFIKLQSTAGGVVGNLKGKLGKLAIGLIAVESAVNLVTRAFVGLKSVGNVIAQFVKDSADLESHLTHLSVVLGNKDLTQEMFKKFQDFAQHTPFNLEQSVKAGILFRQAGIATEDLIPMMGLLGDVSAGDSYKFQRMSLNMMQVLTKGYADAIDLREFENAGVSIRRVLKEVGVEGKISANNVLWALKEMTKEGQPFHRSMWNMAQTFSGALSQMKDSAQRTSAVIGNAFNKPLMRVMRTLELFLTDLRETNSAFTEFLTNMENKMQKFVDKLPSFINKTVIFSTILAGAFGAVVIAISLIFWQISLIVLAVIALGDVLLEAFDISDSAQATYSQIGKLELSFIRLGQVTGYFVGVFKLAFDLIRNVLGLVFNVATDIYNIFYSIFGIFVAIFTGNWTTAIDSLKASFMGFLITLLDVVGVVADVIGAVWGMFDKKPKWVSNFAEFRNKLREENNAEKARLGLIQQVEMAQITGVMDESNKWGNVAGIFGKSLDEAFKNKKDVPEDYNTFNPKFDPNGNLLVNDKSKVQLAEDFRDLLLQQARMRFYTYVNTVTPTVNVGGVTITEGETDVEDFIDVLTNAVQGTATVSAGVM